MCFPFRTLGIGICSSASSIATREIRIGASRSSRSMSPNVYSTGRIIKPVFQSIETLYARLLLHTTILTGPPVIPASVACAHPALCAFILHSICASFCLAGAAMPFRALPACRACQSVVPPPLTGTPCACQRSWAVSSALYPLPRWARPHTDITHESVSEEQHGWHNVGQRIRYEPLGPRARAHEYGWAGTWLPLLLRVTQLQTADPT